jgi:hypothetical protein
VRERDHLHPARAATQVRGVVLAEKPHLSINGLTAFGAASAQPKPAQVVAAGAGDVGVD